ncbi:MAG TPA: toxin-antitoxin system HicB family antitoxin [Verrucomicrobiae bacterium]|nr:toxin-antitoxin system HicB family antitoxin [Verrucomicrobiae bacterium]
MSAIQIELPEPVHQRAQKLALAQSMSLDRLMVVALVEKLSTVFPDNVLEKRARRGNRNGFEKFMADVPDVEPDESDRLPKGFKAKK